MSTCTSSPHPMVSTSYHSLAASPSRACAGAPFGGEPGILFSPFFGNADAARPLPTSCATHIRCFHTTALPTTSDDALVAPQSRQTQNRIRHPAAIAPWSRRARGGGSSMILPKISTSTALTMAETGSPAMAHAGLECNHASGRHRSFLIERDAGSPLTASADHYCLHKAPSLVTWPSAFNFGRLDPISSREGVRR